MKMERDEMQKHPPSLSHGKRENGCCWPKTVRQGVCQCLTENGGGAQVPFPANRDGREC